MELGKHTKTMNITTGNKTKGQFFVSDFEMKPSETEKQTVISEIEEQITVNELGETISNKS